jgi:hypothetical protein
MATRDAQSQTRAARTAWKALCRKRRTERRKVERAAARAERDARRKAVAKAGLRQSLGRPRKPRSRPARWTDYHPDHPTTAYHAIISGEVRTRARYRNADLAELFGVCPTTITHWLDRHQPFARAIDRAGAARFALWLVGRLGIRVRLDESKTNPNAKSWKGHLRGGKAIVREPMRKTDVDRLNRVTRALHARRTLPLAQAALAAELAYAGERYDRSACIERDRLRRQLEEFGGTPVATVEAIVESGHLSGRAIAKALGIGESTLRLWRRQYPELDRVIREAVDGYRRPEPEPEHRDARRPEPEPEHLRPSAARDDRTRRRGHREPSKPAPKRLFPGIYADDADQRL